MKDTVRQTILVVAVIVTIVINILANALPINGKNTGQISDQFPVLFVPDGYVFAIWGLIYLGLVALAIYQALPRERENARLRRVGIIFALGCLANTAWIFFWHYEVFPLTLLAMLTLLGTLIITYLGLGIQRERVSAGEHWAVHVPISVYLGWITVATIANVTDLLYFLGWNGQPLAPTVWAVIMLAAAVIIAALVALTRGDVAYLLVLVWAFVGIYVKQAATPLVAISALVAAGLVAALAVAGFVLRSRKRAQWAS